MIFEKTEKLDINNNLVQTKVNLKNDNMRKYAQYLTDMAILTIGFTGLVLCINLVVTDIPDSKNEFLWATFYTGFYLMGSMPWAIVGIILVLFHPWKLANEKYWNKYNSEPLFKNIHEKMGLFYKIISIFFIIVQAGFIFTGLSIQHNWF